MYRAPRGTQDILPEQQPYWRYLIDRIHRIAELYGYQQIDTPTFEDTGVFTRGVGETSDIVEKEMYTFQDRGNHSLTLRPEFTTPVVRAYLEHGMHTFPQPVKLYSVAPVFRYERPQAGRYREHHQFNVETIGEADPSLDAEIISIAWQLYQEIGFRGLGVQLNSIGCPKCRPNYIRELREHYLPLVGEICPDCERRLTLNPLRLLDCKNASCQAIANSAPRSADCLCDECAHHFAALRHYLTLLDIPYDLNPRLVRGLDYYTKTVFEMWAEGIGAQNAVCGGGRYDGLAEALGGPPTPGVGFASGLERVILSIQEEGIPIPALSKPFAFVAYLGQEAHELAAVLLAQLRRGRVAAIGTYGRRSLRYQLRRAHGAGVYYTLIIGEDELATGMVTVRNMHTGKQHQIPQGEVLAWLRKAAGPAGK